MENLRLIGYTLIAILAALVYANWDVVENQWEGASEWKRMGVAFAIVFFGTAIAAWALWPLAKYIM